MAKNQLRSPRETAAEQSHCIMSFISSAVRGRWARAPDRKMTKYFPQMGANRE
jgi:hypothetical protein